MNALVILCALASHRGTVNMRGMLGEWQGWQIAEGSWYVNPPRKSEMKLVLSANGTFTLRDHIDSIHYVWKAHGTYTVESDHIRLDVHRDNFLSTFVVSNHLIWDIHAFTGPEYVFARPGKKPTIPTSRDGAYILPRPAF